MEVKLCECGCGMPAPLATQTYTQKGRSFRAGDSQRFILGHNQRGKPQSEAFKRSRRIYRKGGEHPNWKGGRTKSSDGYILVYAPEHPQSNPRGYCFEHRLVMEQSLGRFLSRQESVHHRNQIRDDNRIGNLELVSPYMHKLRERECQGCFLRLENRRLKAEIELLRQQCQQKFEVEYA